jgi:hypothetical protein
VPTPTIHNGVEEMLPKLFFIFPLLNRGADSQWRPSLVGGRSRGSALLRLGTHYYHTTWGTAATDGSPPSSSGGAAQPSWGAAAAAAVLLKKKNAHYQTGTLRFERKTRNGLAFNVGRLFSTHTHTHTLSDAKGEESSSAILAPTLYPPRTRGHAQTCRLRPQTTTLIDTET